MHFHRISLSSVFLVFLAFSGSRLCAFTITPDFVNLPAGGWTDNERAVVNQAITDWTTRVSFGDENDRDIPVGFFFTSAGTGGYLAQWQYGTIRMVPYPYSPGVSHYVAFNSDRLAVDSFSLEGPVVDRYDMLTAVRHELGHALGFAPGLYQGWSDHIAQNVFDPVGLNVPMAPNGAHVALPGDLMASTLGKGERREISNTDLSMLALAYGYSITPVPEPSSLLMLGLGAGALLFCRKPASRDWRKSQRVTASTE